MDTRKIQGPTSKSIFQGTFRQWNQLHSVNHFWMFLFQLTLTSHVSNEDFQLGYSMSGHVERSFEKYISFQITHLAFVRRRDFQSN